VRSSRKIAPVVLTGNQGVKSTFEAGGFDGKLFGTPNLKQSPAALKLQASWNGLLIDPTGPT